MEIKMRVNLTGLIDNTRSALTGPQASYYAAGLETLHDHLLILRDACEKGDIGVAHEFFELYCFEERGEYTPPGVPEPEPRVWGPTEAFVVVPGVDDPQGLIIDGYRSMLVDGDTGSGLQLILDGHPLPFAIQHAENILAKAEAREPTTLEGTHMDALNVAAGLEDPSGDGMPFGRQIAAYYWIKDGVVQ